MRRSFKLYSCLNCTCAHYSFYESNNIIVTCVTSFLGDISLTHIKIYFNYILHQPNIKLSRTEHASPYISARILNQ